MSQNTAGRRILFVGEYAGFFGGIERYMFQTAAILRRNGWSVDLLCEKSCDDRDFFTAGFDRVLTWGEPVLGYDLVAVHKIRDAALLESLGRAGKLVMVVHDHEYSCPRKCRYSPGNWKNCSRGYSSWRCGLCGMLRRHPDWRENFIRIPRLWRAIKQVPHFVVLSQFMREMLVINGIPGERVRVIPPAVAVPDTPPVKSVGGTVRLLISGQQIRGKGVDQALLALRGLPGDWHLDILGRGNMNGELRSMASEFNADQITFHEWSREPERFFARADIVLLPWRWQEPFGLVGAEALAQSCALIGFDLGGIREYLIDGEDGILVKPGDSAGFRAAVAELLADPAKRARFGAYGYNFVREKFSAAALSAGWAGLL